MNITHCAAAQPGMNEKQMLAVLQSLSKFVTELTRLQQCCFYGPIRCQICGNSLLLKLSFPQVFSKVRMGKESDSEESVVLNLVELTTEIYPRIVGCSSLLPN